MKVNNEKEALKYIVDENPNGTNERFLKHHLEKIKNYPCNIAYCHDEKSGRRFGNSKKRNHLNPEKIGSGGRNKGSNYPYQLWIWDVE